MIEISRNMIAGYIAYNLPDKHRDLMGNKVQVRVFYDCWGEFMIAENVGFGSAAMALSAPGAGWAYPVYASTVAIQEGSPQEILIDTRTLDMFKAGCCPIELTGTQLGGMEGKD